MPLLSVSDLRVTFHTDRGRLRALDGVDFEVDQGEVLCLVGESGSGKTVACEALTRLVPTSTELRGTIRFDDRNLLSVSDKALQSVRGNRIAHVFQNPQGALDPVYTVGDQLMEALRIHRDVPKSTARRRAVKLLDRVGIPDPAERIDEYPHEFSGGMKQRAVIAMALVTDPELLVADEPTTALDVTTQSQILKLLRELQTERDMAMVFVTHDLGVAAQIADKIAVLYAGKVMERGSTEEIFRNPAHPYTKALLNCLPRRDQDPEPIDGTLPDPTDLLDGCRFHPRCPHAVPECKSNEQPREQPVGGDHYVSCIHYRDDRDASILDRRDETNDEEEERR